MGLVFVFVISSDADFLALGFFISLALFLVLFHVLGKSPRLTTLVQSRENSRGITGESRRW